ncbi:MAG: ATP-binding cassette domain-containing protein [Clostridiales bacterium]|nr:ATP-binding cassette domain-containing protein [Clostridiales bacterium]
MELRLEGLQKSYNHGKTYAVKNCTVFLTPGVYALLGPNGAGKSTLMNMITDNLAPDGGSITLDGVTIDKLGANYRALLGYMPQQQGLYDDFTGEQFLWYMAALKGMSRQQAKDAVGTTLETVNLKDARFQKIKSYSGGMKQRLLIGQALLNDPKILILDEPTAGLDPRERIRIRNLIAQLGGDRIILLATHIVSDVEMIASQILIMRKGLLCKQGQPHQLEEELQGKVLLYPIKEAEAHVSSGCLAGNSVRRGDEIWIHLVGDDLPPGGLPPESVTLDDVYLYWTGEAGM